MFTSYPKPLIAALYFPQLVEVMNLLEIILRLTSEIFSGLAIHSLYGLRSVGLK